MRARQAALGPALDRAKSKATSAELSELFNTRAFLSLLKNGR